MQTETQPGPCGPMQPQVMPRVTATQKRHLAAVDRRGGRAWLELSLSHPRAATTVELVEMGCLRLEPVRCGLGGWETMVHLTATGRAALAA